MNLDQIGIGMTSERTRQRLLDRLRVSGIRNEMVLAALGLVPRHLFVDEALASRAYEDTALPIGDKQTISQPYVVALMTQTVLEGSKPENVLEIGTGCGYQTAVLAELIPQVSTVERLPDLQQEAKRRLVRLGYNNIQFKVGDGGQGWLERAPFDAIIVTAAAAKVPVPLLQQLREGGRMVIPVGSGDTQDLLLYTRENDEFSCQLLEKVCFVPLVTQVAGH